MSLVFLDRGRGARPVRLGQLLGEGAAGKVHAVGEYPGFAAKIYHGEAEAQRYEPKIDLMLANPPALPPLVRDGVRYPQIAWPYAKLYDSRGRFIGFLMPEIDFSRSTSLVNMLQKNSRRAEKISEFYGYRVLVARNLAAVFAELHGAGHHMIDLKPANLRFYPATSWMAVVDTDGFSIAGSGRRMPAEQVSDEYIAPESWQRKPAELGIAQDLFALAVNLFQLLDNGVHPFAGTSAEAGHATDLQARIREGLYPYGLEPRGTLVPSTASVHRMFGRGTRLLFDRAFLGASEGRPGAAEWRDHLDELIARLTPCASKPGEHAHFGNGCGFCGHEARVAAAANAASARPRPVPVPVRTMRPPPRRGMHPAAARPMALRHPVPMVWSAPLPPRRRRLWRILPVAMLIAALAPVLAPDLSWWQFLSGSGSDLRPASIVPLGIQASGDHPVTVSLATETRVAPDPSEQRIAGMYESLMAEAHGHDRQYLSLGHRLWLDQRDECRHGDAPLECIERVDARRIADLGAWLEIEKRSIRLPSERSSAESVLPAL